MTNHTITNRSNQDLDLVAELRLRQWARRNYVPSAERHDDDWHSIVVDEMRRIDQDRSLIEAAQEVVTSDGIQALEPSRHDGVRIDEPHAGIGAPRIQVTTSANTQVETYTPCYI